MELLNYQLESLYDKYTIKMLLIIIIIYNHNIFCIHSYIPIIICLRILQLHVLRGNVIDLFEKNLSL